MFVGWLAGALGNSMFDGNSMLVGASGGVYALIGAHLAIVIMVMQLASTCPLPVSRLVFASELEGDDSRLAGRLLQDDVFGHDAAQLVDLLR